MAYVGTHILVGILGLDRGSQGDRVKLYKGLEPRLYPSNSIITTINDNANDTVLSHISIYGRASMGLFSLTQGRKDGQRHFRGHFL